MAETWVFVVLSKQPPSLKPLKAIRCHLPASTIENIFTKLLDGIFYISIGVYPCQSIHITINEINNRVYVSIVLDRVKVDKTYLSYEIDQEDLDTVTFSDLLKTCKKIIKPYKSKVLLRVFKSQKFPKGASEIAYSFSNQSLESIEKEKNQKKSA